MVHAHSGSPCERDACRNDQPAETCMSLAGRAACQRPAMPPTNMCASLGRENQAKLSFVIWTNGVDAKKHAQCGSFSHVEGDACSIAYRSRHRSLPDEENSDG